MIKSNRLSGEVTKGEALALRRSRGLEGALERRILGTAASDKDALGGRRGSGRV